MINEKVSTIGILHTYARSIALVVGGTHAVIQISVNYATDVAANVRMERYVDLVVHLIKPIDKSFCPVKFIILNLTRIYISTQYLLQSDDKHSIEVVEVNDQRRYQDGHHTGNAKDVYDILFVSAMNLIEKGTYNKVCIPLIKRSMRRHTSSQPRE